MTTININPGYESPFPGVRILTAGSRDERVNNIRAATALGIPRLKMQPVNEETLQIVCFGPSLNSTWESIRRGAMPIMTVSGAHDFLIMRGIVPTYFVDAETRQHKAGMVTPVHGVKYLLASCCHPDIFFKLRDEDIMLWHRGASSEEDQAVIDSEKSTVFVSCGSAIGLDAIGVGLVLGYRKFHIHGMDCSYRTNWLRRVIQHAAKHPNPSQVIRECKVGGRTFVTSPEMFASAQEFMNVVTQSGAEFTIFGDGMLANMCEYFSIPKVTRQTQ